MSRSLKNLNLKIFCVACRCYMQKICRQNWRGCWHATNRYNNNWEEILTIDILRVLVNYINLCPQPFPCFASKWHKFPWGMFNECYIHHYVCDVPPHHTGEVIKIYSPPFFLKKRGGVLNYAKHIVNRFTSSDCSTLVLVMLRWGGGGGKLKIKKGGGAGARCF